MEMLFEGFDEDSQKKYRDKDGMYINVCKWDCVECDDNGRVVKLTVRRYVSGSLHIRYIPPKVKLLDISSKQLKGTIDYAEFPESIEILYLRHISWESAMHTATLPKKSAHFRQPQKPNHGVDLFGPSPKKHHVVLPGRESAQWHNQFDKNAGKPGETLPLQESSYGFD